MKYTFAFIIAFLFAVASQAQQVTHPFKEMETELMQQVNEYRKEIGVRPLKQHVYVSNIAERHSRDMASQKVHYGHDGYKQRTDKIFDQLKPVYSFGENIAVVRSSVKEAIDEWVTTPKQKKVLEGDYNYSGIGIIKAGDSFLVTQIFILK